MGWAILVSLLKNKSLNPVRKVRKFCSQAWENRLHFGGVNECIWLCFMTFMFFGMWQLNDTDMPYSWSYANFATAIFCVFLCLFMVVWVIYLILAYRQDYSLVPKKHKWILGDDS